MVKRIISFLLVMSMLLLALPTAVLADSLKQEPENEYIDVNKADWFYESVTYCLENGIFGGTGEGTFSPGASLTRAMYVTVLGRIAGVDTSQYNTSAFKDVAVDAWYAPYVAWAVENGITYGTGNDTFSPDEAITREQMATMTVRYFKSRNLSYEAERQIASVPKDASAISFWALDSVLSLWHAGLLAGDGNGNFNPASNATRAEAAAFCMRISKTVKQQEEKKQPTPAPTPTSSQDLGNDRGESRSDNLYTITFATNGGDAIDNLRLRPGTALNNLPVPYKMDAVFLGWYKDSSLSTPVSSTDKITGNMTLYAKYAASTGFTEELSVPTISKLDQDKTFTITVVDSTKVMTAAEVKAGMTFDSPSNPGFAGIQVDESSDGEFIVSAIGGAFDEGGTFKLTLDNDNLSFKGEDESTRICTFTIAKSPVMNLSLNKNMKYLSAGQISDMTQNGYSVKSLSIPLVRVAGDGPSDIDAEGGTFVYDGGGINVGDTVAIYEGIRPDQRDLDTRDDDAGDIAYVTITAISGTTYSYVKADEKDILFTPDVLPVSTTADTDGSSDNNSITVPQSVMAYTDAIYADIGLNAATTVDVGDFIAFHTGTFGSADAENAGYAEITSVTVSGDNYIIAYMPTTPEQMWEAADLYTTKEVDGDELLENVDIAALEESVERQAIQSGFADEAAQYLMEMAMKTDSFRQLNLIAMADTSSPGYMPMLAAPGSGPEVKNLRVNARVFSYLPHLGGSGARVTLTISCDIVFQAAGEDNNIVIRLSGSFEQEVKVDLNVSCETKWTLLNGWFWWAEDTLVTASIDTGTYTSININASIGTFERGAQYDLSKFQDIGKQIKDIMNGKKPEDSAIADTLREKYKSMLEEDSDWVDIYKKEIFTFEQAIDPFHIVVFGMDVDFVVGAKMNVSIGCNFSYESEKRYIFSLYINAQTATSDTIDLRPEQYNFTFYIMGTLGLRAGISVELKVGLFSLDLASIGIEGEVGAYVQLWGYFYYEASYRQATGLTSKYGGAMYLEFGIYLEISFVAQAIDNMFEYEATLYENQWPLLTFGSQEDVYDFEYSADEAPTAFMAKQTKSFVLPDSVFSMNYMDMKTGDIESKNYDPSNFDYSTTNSDFTYDPATKTVTVAPGEKDITEGALVLIWKGNPVAFTSVPIARAVPLHWEDLKSAYTISFNSRGGSAVDTIALPYRGVIVPPANPVKAGYVFGGWYKDEALTQSYTFPATMPAEDTVLYARWVPAPNTKYRVEHYKQNLENDLYTLAETEYRTGTTDSVVHVSPKSYEGFTLVPSPQIVQILPDGSTVHVFHYNRNSYSATFQPNNGKIGADVENTVKFGGKINVPVFTRARHSFAGWSPAVPETMPAQNMTFEAQWTTVGQVAYKVEHYKEGLDGSYALAETENLTDVANQMVTATAKSYGGFSYNRNAPGTVPSGIVTSDGNLVLKLYYTRNSYTLTFDANGGTGGITRQAKFGEPISAPAVAREGYSLTGWSPAVPATMPAENATYTAQWQAVGLIPYRVEHYLENLDDGYILTDIENLSGAEGDTATASTKSYNGFEYLAGFPTVASGEIAADGSLVLKLYYMRNNVTLEFDADGGSAGDNELDYQYGDFFNEFPPGTIEGYAFNGWSPAFMGTAPAEDTTYTAQWTSNISEALDVATAVYSSQDYSVSGVDWDYEAQTLTLTNVVITAPDSTDSGVDNFALKVPDGTTIILVGSNYLQSGKGPGINSYGILCDGDLIIQGPGTLTALGTPNFMSLADQVVCYGIYAAGTITIENDAAVIAKSTGATFNSCGIFAEDVYITDSTVLASSNESANGIRCGIYASGDIDITNSTVNTPSGIYASGDAAISESTVNALNSGIEYPDDVFNYYGIYGNNVAITGGTVYITSQSANGYGIYAAAGVAITGSAAVTARCSDFGGPGTGSGIYADTGSIYISGSTVIAAGKDALAMNKAPVLDNAEAFCASTSADGSGGVIYDSGDIATYRYIQIRAD
ncbi:MAG TPA: InlB B-repeat-containing protein [Bacillota bacterium]|nr:InlB B-repeat-containing protein [Bacillota bacterium]